jgi:hypothetical protein
MPLALLCVAIAGVATTATLLIGGGAIHLSLLRGHVYPEVSKLAGLGGILVAGAVLAGWALQRQARGTTTAIVAGTTVAFVASMIALVPQAFNDVKGGRAIADTLPRGQLTREVRLGTYGWMQPSLVFYCQRGVERLSDEQAIQLFLSSPHESYVCLPDDVWQNLALSRSVQGQPISRHFDFYKRKWIVVVANEQGLKAAEASSNGTISQRADAVRTNRP